MNILSQLKLNFLITFLRAMLNLFHYKKMINKTTTGVIILLNGHFEVPESWHTKYILTCLLFPIFEGIFCLLPILLKCKCLVISLNVAVVKVSFDEQKELSVKGWRVERIGGEGLTSRKNWRWRVDV